MINHVAAPNTQWFLIYKSHLVVHTFSCVVISMKVRIIYFPYTMHTSQKSEKYDTGNCKNSIELKCKTEISNYDWRFFDRFMSSFYLCQDFVILGGFGQIWVGFRYFFALFLSNLDRIWTEFWSKGKKNVKKSAKSTKSKEKIDLKPSKKIFRKSQSQFFAWLLIR